MSEMVQAAIENAGAYVLFGILMMGMYCAALLVVMFVVLALHDLWCALMRWTWRDVVLVIERRALRRGR
jgi:hypothetical protein